MSSRRSNYPHIQPNSPLDRFMTSAEAGIDSISSRLDRSKEEEKKLQSQCSHCGKIGGEALKSCSRCKYVRICTSSPCIYSVRNSSAEPPGIATKPVNSRTSRHDTNVNARTSPILQLLVSSSQSRWAVSGIHRVLFLHTGTTAGSAAGLAAEGASTASASA